MLFAWPKLHEKQLPRSVVHYDVLARSTRIAERKSTAEAWWHACLYCEHVLQLQLTTLFYGFCLFFFYLMCIKVLHANTLAHGGVLIQMSWNQMSFHLSSLALAKRAQSLTAPMLLMVLSHSAAYSYQISLGTYKPQFLPGANLQRFKQSLSIFTPTLHATVYVVTYAAFCFWWTWEVYCLYMVIHSTEFRFSCFVRFFNGLHCYKYLIQPLLGTHY